MMSDAAAAAPAPAPIPRRSSRRLQGLQALVAVALLVLAGPAGAVLNIKITQGASGARPIAVVPFAWSGPGKAPADIAGIVSTDLTRSGQFAPIERRNLVAQPSTAKAIHFGNWRTLGADHLVIGRIRPAKSSDGYSVQFQLFDVAQQKQIAGYRLTAPGHSLRGLAHRISDIVYKAITNERGAFATRIAFVSAEGKGDDRRLQLQVADYDGYNARTILTSREPIMSPAWSPDGKRLAYVSFESGTPAVYVQRIASGKRHKISGGAGINGAPAWSPDGKRLAVTLSRDGNPEIYVISMATGKKQRITHSGGIDTSADWTPDGQTLIFTSDRSGGPQLYRIKATGQGNARRLTFDGRYNADPDVSPDGRRIAFTHRTSNNRFRIAVFDRDSELTRIVSRGRLDESPTFSPNGRMILFAGEHNGRGVLGSVSVDGRASARLSGVSGDVREPAWGPYEH